MADLAASLIGIISAGTKVAMVLSSVASELRSAGKEAQIMAREIRSFCAIIRSLSHTMDSVTGINADQHSHCEDVISEMTAVSKEMFTEILSLVGSIQKGIGGHSPVSPGPQKLNLAGRIKWVMNKPKFLFLRSALETYKSNLCLLLGSIQLSQSIVGSEINTPHQVRTISPTPESGNNSHILSLAVRDLAHDYQASIHELDAARCDAEDEDEDEDVDEPHSFPATEDDQGESQTTTSPRGTELEQIIQSAQREVASLHSKTSLYSVSTSSIYTSLSRNSQRLSGVIDQLPEPFHETKTLLRASVALTTHSTRESAALLPNSGALSTTTNEPYSPQSRTQRNLHSKLHLPFCEHWGWSNGVPPWGDILVATKLIKVLLNAESTMDSVHDGSLFLDWARMLVKDVSSLDGSSARTGCNSVRTRYLSNAASELADLPSWPHNIGKRMKSPRGGLKSFSSGTMALSSTGLMSPHDDSASNTTDQDAHEPLRSEHQTRRESKADDWTSPTPASGEVFKKFRVSLNDPVYKVLPAALKIYKINTPWDQFGLFIVYGDQERRLGLEEKPLRVFNQLDKEGKKPMFMLRKHEHSDVAAIAEIVDSRQGTDDTAT